MMTIILNQRKLAGVVHDPQLRHHLTNALEYEGDEANKLAALREYLVHCNLADKVSARPDEPKHIHDEIPDENADE